MGIIFFILHIGNHIGIVWWGNVIRVVKYNYGYLYVENWTYVVMFPELHHGHKGRYNYTIIQFSKCKGYISNTYTNILSYLAMNHHMA